MKLQTPMYKAYPIYDWKTEDVWTAPAKFGWDYCEAYDLMEMAGIRPRDQRLAPPYGEQPFRHLWMWKVCFPALWEKMCDRVPGASAGALYSHAPSCTVLGGAASPRICRGSNSCKSVIEEHPAEDAPRHRGPHAPDDQPALQGHAPIRLPPTSRIPTPGLSWSLMVKIAEIADTKNRNDPIVEAGKLRNQCKGDVGADVGTSIAPTWRTWTRALTKCPKAWKLAELTEPEDSQPMTH